LTDARRYCKLRGMDDYRQRFVQLAMARQALRFGEFRLKSGRVSPYFFNAGQFADGDSLATLGECYAAALAAAGLAYDMLFGPAYKGIPLVAAAAIALSRQQQRNVPWAFNRKETKDHGEAGLMVGTPLKGRVVIVDDVITAGTAVRESVEMIRRAGAEPVAVALALDRQERGTGDLSAVQEVESVYGLKCISIMSLERLIQILQAGGQAGAPQLAAMQAYRAEYGIAN
jgi:orotate phosphoribosyltransferase